MKFESLLKKKKEINSSLRKLLVDLANASEEIYQQLKTTHKLYEEKNTKNNFGEEQLKIDILAHEIIRKHLRANQGVNAFLSEEGKEIEKSNSSGSFFVGYDPLDGSSLVRNNLTLGSIYGIWQTDNIYNQVGSDLKAALYALYGINLNIVLVVEGLGVFNFIFKQDEISEKKFFSINPIAKNFSFGNLKACRSNFKIKKLLNHFIDKEKKIRYTGCLIADFHKIITDRQGIFTYLSDKKEKDKLRLIFECAPLAYIAHELGGWAVDQKGNFILEIPIMNKDQTSSIMIGSKDEVKNSLKIVKTINKNGRN